MTGETSCCKYSNLKQHRFIILEFNHAHQKTSWVSPLQVPQVEVEVSAGVHFTLEALSECCHSSVSCSCRTEIPAHLLAVSRGSFPDSEGCLHSLACGPFFFSFILNASHSKLSFSHALDFSCISVTSQMICFVLLFYF
jgi:hypothetical protein